jgi:hypothetical protein
MNLTFKPWQKNAAIIAAAVTVVAGVVAGRERPSMEIIQERAKPLADDGIDLAKLRRPDASLPQNDPFSVRFQEKKGPVETQKAAAPAAPVVPALPFRYFGKLVENGATDVFVMRGDELIALKQGQQIGDYRVEEIAANGISFTYLPLKTRQTLDLQQ